MTGRKLTMRDNTVYHYTTNGGVQELTAIEDRKGNQLTIAWSSGELQSVTAPDGRMFTFTHSSGQLVQINGPSSKAWTIGYTGKQLTSVQFPQPLGKNRLVTLGYDVNDNIIEELDPEGNLWTWTYSGDDCTGWQDPASSNPASATFSPITGGLEMQPAFGLAWEHVYSGGLLWIDQDGEGFFTEYLAYDTAVNKPTDLNDKRGMPWEFAYNAMGQVTDKWTPLGHHTNITYTALNDVDVITGPVTGEFMDYDYNGNGLLEKVTQSVDSTPTDREVVTLDYDGNGDILWTRDALKRQTDYVVNANGDVEEVYPPDNADKFFAYDDYGRLTDSYDNASNLTTTTYDETGWPIRVDHPDSSYVEFEYDDCGRKTDFYDELFRHQIWAYDESGRMTSHTNGRGDVNSYLYNAQDLVETHTNGNSTSWDYYYTNRGELFVLMHPGYQVESWAYDGNGNTTNTRLNAGMSLDVVDYVYDDDNRQIVIDYPTDTDVTFDYDDANRRIEMLDGTGTTEWTYDLAGQVTLLETPQGDVSYTYNDDGTRDTMTEVGLGTMSYAWDAATGQLTSQTNRFSETTSYDYDPSLGQMTKKTLDNGSYTEYTHDSRYRVDSVTHRKANTTLIGSEAYSWNVAGELDDKTVDGVTTTYAYDDASQLTDESRSGYVANYTYDDNGNRLTKTLNSVTETYIYGPEERLEEITGGSDPREFTYDDGGRTATIDRGSGDVTNFTYDEGSRLTQITRPGMTTNSYTYNALDTRVGMTDSLGSRGFARDGVDVADAVLNDGTRAYTPGVSQRQSGNSKFVLDDYLGTTGRLLDSGENVTDTFSYDAFGVQTARTGSTVRPFGYAGAHGYQEDGDTGFKLLGHRYYDPSTGRFLTRDPIKDGTNWYAYCENNPLSGVDPEGLQGGFTHDGGEVVNNLPSDSDWEVIVLGYDDSVKGGGTNYKPIYKRLPGGKRTQHWADTELAIIVNKRTGEVHVIKVYDFGILYIAEDSEGKLVLTAGRQKAIGHPAQWWGTGGRAWEEVKRGNKWPHGGTGQDQLDKVPKELRPPRVPWPSRRQR